MWKNFVVTYRVRGKQVHDARLAVLMAAHHLNRILTLNPSDFVRYPRIEPVTPADVLRV